MIPFDQIDKRLEALGKDRSWLSQESGRKPDSIRVALAPNAPPAKRSSLLQKALSDAIEREEEVQGQAPVTVSPLDRITLEVDTARMDSYLEASKYARQTLKEWTIHELDRAAKEWAKLSKPSFSVVADELRQDAK